MKRAINEPHPLEFGVIALIVLVLTFASHVGGAW